MRTAIIGAGITGLYLAWKLSERGHKVTVFEKKDKIGKEACSGLFSERILKFIPQSQKLIQNEINFVLIHFPGKTIRVYFTRRFFVMSHAELDKLAVNLARNSGARIQLNYNVTSPDDVTFFDRVVGCDGADSKVRKYLGLPEPNYRLGMLGFTPKEDYSNFVETWPITSHQGSGGRFIWKIPRGKEIEYGIIAAPKEARALFEEFCKKNNIQLQRIKSAPIPQGFLIPKHQSITLCGDAAGLTKPWSGGGVIWGLTAADLLLKNFPDFLKYKKDLKRFFLPEIIFSKFVTKMAYFFGFNIPCILPKNFKIESDFLF